MAWLTSPSHHRWLEAESLRLIDFARASQHQDGGFGMLGADGALDADADVEYGSPAG
ncbi:hypothetical protein [Demequina litorisediminis]|uniref:hypothetical protein n=1 Tax=Demequina litorisediminis TaxID=1849022 RepID=UPI0032AF7614